MKCGKTLYKNDCCGFEGGRLTISVKMMWIREILNLHGLRESIILALMRRKESTDLSEKDGKLRHLKARLLMAMEC